MKYCQQIISYGISLIALTVLCFFLGLVLNACRQEPIGMQYQSPAQRLIQSTSQEAVFKNKKATGQKPSSKPKMQSQIKIIQLDEFMTLRLKDKAYVLDVRPKLFYNLGHIPQSLNMPIQSFNKIFPKFAPGLSKAIHEGKQIVIYCAGPHCPDASKIAKRLSELGYIHLNVFEGGWEIWQGSGLE